MIHYILQVVVFQFLFWACYELFFKKETFFILNRFYLLITSVLSLVLPLLPITWLQQQIPSQYWVSLPSVFIGNTGTAANENMQFLDEVVISASTISATEVVTAFYLIGIGVALFFFGRKWIQLQQLRKQGTRTIHDNYNLIVLPNSDVAFSFFEQIYLGDQLSTEQQELILEHERVHVHHKHSYDLMFFEMLRVIFWFNPMVYLLQHQMKALHEFTADRLVTKEVSRVAYYEQLLTQLFQTTNLSFTNTFFTHSFIKKRIIMLQKTNSKKLRQFKYILILPLLAAMLTYTSCSNENSSEAVVANSEVDSEVMQKINELADAIMKKGNISDDEERALKFLAMEAKEGDRIYTSVQEYLDETEEIPYGVIEKVPTYLGCSGSNEEMKSCMSKEITVFVGENFNTKVDGYEKMSGKQRIWVLFKIDRSGMVTGVKARAAFPALEQEAIRVISSLPQMEPGMQEGKTVNVIYSLPIVFEISE